MPIIAPPALAQIAGVTTDQRATAGILDVQYGSGLARRAQTMPLHTWKPNVVANNYSSNRYLHTVLTLVTWQPLTQIAIPFRQTAASTYTIIQAAITSTTTMGAAAAAAGLTPYNVTGSPDAANPTGTPRYTYFSVQNAGVYSPYPVFGATPIDTGTPLIVPAAGIAQTVPGLYTPWMTSAPVDGGAAVQSKNVPVDYWTDTIQAPPPQARTDGGQGFIYMIRLTVDRGVTGPWTLYSSWIDTGYAYAADVIGLPGSIVARGATSATVLGMTATWSSGGFGATPTGPLMLTTTAAGVSIGISGDSHAGGDPTSGRGFIAYTKASLDSAACPIQEVKMGYGSQNSDTFWVSALKTLPTIKPGIVFICGWSYNDLPGIAGSPGFGVAGSYPYYATYRFGLGRALQLADVVRSYGGQPILIGPLPRDVAMSVTPDSLAAWQAIRSDMVAAARVRGLPFLDAATILENPAARNAGTYNPTLSTDVTHPNELGQKALADGVTIAAGSYNAATMNGRRQGNGDYLIPGATYLVRRLIGQ